MSNRSGATFCKNEGETRLLNLACKRATSLMYCQLPFSYWKAIEYASQLYGIPAWDIHHELVRRKEMRKHHKAVQLSLGL